MSINDLIEIKDKHIYIAFKIKDTHLPSKPQDPKYITNTQALMSYCNQILSNNCITSMSFEAIYSLCYKICIKKGEKHLSEKLHELLTDYLTKAYETDLSKLFLNEIEYFQRAIELYSRFMAKIAIIQKTLMYYETNYLRKSNKRDIKEEAKDVFFSVVIASRSSEEIVALLLSLINDCREKEESTRQFIFRLMGMLIDLNESFVKDSLKEAFLKNEERYHREVYASIGVERNFEERIRFVTKCLDEEENYIIQCNLTVFKPKLLELFHKEMIVPLLFTNPSIEQLLKPVLMNKSIVILSTMYSLCKVVNGDAFLELLSKAIESIGKALMKECKLLSDQGIPKLINEVLLFLQTVTDVSSKLQIDNQLYWEVLLKDHLSTFINSSGHLLAKILPRYIDICFTQTVKPSKDIAVDLRLFSLNSVIDLFKFIKDKGLFELQYRRLLGFRLLKGVYQELQERSLLSKMTLICGSMYCRKCEAMLNDFKESNEYTVEYYNERTTPVGIGFQLKVLTSSNWELKKDEVNRHESLYLLNEPFNKEFSHLPCINLMKDYFDFYMKYHPNIVITHYLSIGYCEVGALINGKAYLLIASPIQSLFLMLFNRALCHRRITVGGLMKLFLLKDKEKTLELFKPLITAGLFLFEEDAYSFNSQYMGKLSKVIVNPRTELLKMIAEENEVSHSLIKQRNVIVESAIIRLMKAKQRMTHESLVNELLTCGVNFVPDVAMIKSRIEVLIERGYIARDANELNAYQYIA